jgi:hypothetical protein
VILLSLTCPFALNTCPYYANIPSKLIFLEKIKCDRDFYVVRVWDSFSTSLNSYAGETIYLLISAADASSASLIEAAIDDVAITAD